MLNCDFTRKHQILFLVLLNFIVLMACGQSKQSRDATEPASVLPSPTPVPAPTQVVMPAASAEQPAVNHRVSAPAESSGILIGMEYVLIKNPARTKTIAQMLAPIGAPAVKMLPEHIEWGEMQTGPDAPIDFGRLDRFIREFQSVGFTTPVIALKSHSRWASVNPARLGSVDPSPKPEYLELYAQWVSSIVERYDGDGQADMPGLRWPVRYYEIGSEFSTYEPESPEVYLRMLERAYRAAHRAYNQVKVAHAAFLTTNVFKDKPGPGEYETAFAAVSPRILLHRLADIRKILDRPDLFDVVNLHSLGAPDEIEAMVSWVNYEMAQRGYQKPIIISDTATTPFIAWGPATVCDRAPNQMGLIVYPATESDRCRLAAYFTKLVDGDEATLRWTQAFAAEDMVKKVVVAAEQGVVLINTAFVEDLAWFKLKLFQAGTGPSAWAGMVDVGQQEYRPGYYALQQLVRQLQGYQTIERVRVDDERVRLYRLTYAHGQRWIAWLEPGRVILPGDEIPQVTSQIHTGDGPVTVETLITKFGQTAPNQTLLQPADGVVTVTLTPTPIFVWTGA